MTARWCGVMLLIAAAGFTGCAAADSTAPAETAPPPPSASPISVSAGRPDLVGPMPAAGSAASASEPLSIAQWNAQYAALLRQYVHPTSGTVDYTGLRADLPQLHMLIEQLAPTRTFETERHRLALLLNAYNAIVLYSIASHPPATSPRAIDGIYNRRRWSLLGQSLTLDELRDQHIRPMDDPRIHMAISTGALGSAPLRSEPYTIGKLDGQLNDQARRFVGSAAHCAQIGGTLLLSPIFQWFAGDFEGPPFHGPAGFLRLFAGDDTPIARLLARDPSPPIEYMDFNWALNQR